MEQYKYTDESCAEIKIALILVYFHDERKNQLNEVNF